jgi:HTH-type transcriptional regulator/antitoxin HigA
MSTQQMPVRVTSPGRILQRELEERGWTQIDLAEIIKRPVQAINEIIRGSKQITPETALDFAAAFDTSPEFWLNLESNYRLWLVQKNNIKTEISKRSNLYNLLPIRELQKRGWIEETDSTEELEHNVLEFLGIRDLNESMQLVVNFRCSPGKEPDPPSKLAWLRRVKYLAQKKQTVPYRREVLKERISELLAFSEVEADIMKVPDWLGENGVICVFVPHLPKSFIDGAVFYMGNNPVIGLSLRYDRLDSFWFNVCHEIGHILYGTGQSYLDVNLGETDLNYENCCDDEEKIANEFARNCLLDSTTFNHFVRQTKPYFYTQKVIEFAKKQHRHPSIVVGRLQFEKEIPPKNLNSLRVKVKEYLKDYIDS